MNKITTVIITKNEEEKIVDAIKSAKLLSEDVLVIDTGSTDKTISVSKKIGAKVVEYKTGKSFSDYRNKGLKEAEGEWILYLDSDERITKELSEEISLLINNYKDPLGAYAIPRKNIIFGKEFRHGGQWPDYQKRLFLKSNLIKWQGEVHEQPVLKDVNIGHLKEPMLHLKHDNLSEMVDKTNKWSEIEAKLMFEANHPPMNIPRFITAMLREFWLRMIKQKGFMDGAEGIIYSLYQVYSRFISYAKLWEMQENSRLNTNN